MKPLLLVLFLATYVFADGTVYINLTEYRNPTGTGSNGHCCDGRWNLCQNNGCDHKFTICLDYIESDDTTDDCGIARYQSETYDNQDSIVFGNSIGGIENPVKVHFKGSVPSFSIKIHVIDGDGWIQNDDEVDFIRFDFYPNKKFFSETVINRTSLDMAFTIDCETNFYGAFCTECMHTNRYICLDTGEISCLNGWEGPHCELRATTEKMTTTEEIIGTGFDCDDIAKFKSSSADGVYEIMPNSRSFTKTWCHYDPTGGWTLIQRHTNGEDNFDKSWHQFKFGFGHPESGNNFWLGLEHMHQLTFNKKYRVLIKMYLGNGEERYALYDSFRIGSEATGFRLHVEEYSGNAGDALSKHTSVIKSQNGMPFTTKDRDNDAYNGNCAERYKSGWWYHNCFYANLNGEFPNTLDMPKCDLYDCITWSTIDDYRGYSLIGSEMMIKPVTE